MLLQQRNNPADFRSEGAVHGFLHMLGEDRSRAMQEQITQGFGTD